MNANEFGKRLGIGVRVASRIAQQRAQQQAGAAAKASVKSGGGAETRPIRLPKASEMRETAQRTERMTRAAGRGVGGFVRPFQRVGGILWLELTGFFFGLFALYFATDVYRARAGFASGPLHQRFLISAALTALFLYLSLSAFWRAKRK